MSEANTEQQIEEKDLDLVSGLEDETKTADELWKEFDDVEEAGAKDGAATADGAPVAADTDDAGETKEAADATSQPRDDAQAKGGEVDPPASAAKPEKGAQSEQEDETPIDWSKAPPEVRKAYEKLEADRNKLQQSERSQRGRVSTLQRQLNEQAARERQRQAGAGPQTGADKSKPAAKTDPLLDDPEIKAVVDEYPEVAKPILKAVRQVAERQAQRDQVDEDKARVAHWEAQADLLKEAHPDYQDVIAADPNAWRDWIQTQPRHVIEAANRNLKEIEDAAEAADVFSRFKAFRSAQQAPPENGGNAETGQGKTGSLSGRRQRQLDSSSAARGRGPGTARGIPEEGDRDEIWKMFDEEERLAKTG